MLINLKWTWTSLVCLYKQKHQFTTTTLPHDGFDCCSAAFVQWRPQNTQTLQFACLMVSLHRTAAQLESWKSRFRVKLVFLTLVSSEKELQSEFGTDAQPDLKRHKQSKDKNRTILPSKRPFLDPKGKLSYYINGHQSCNIPYIFCNADMLEILTTDLFLLTVYTELPLASC